MHQTTEDITLMAVGTNIYNRMFLDRLTPHTDPKLTNNQNVFRKGRSTIAQILTWRRLVEGIKSKNLPALITLLIFVRRLIQSMGGNFRKY